jgi:hypothetical protein
MFTFGYERSSSCLVGLFSGDALSDGDRERALAAIARLDEEADAAGTAALLIFEPGLSPLRPEWRRGLSELRRREYPHRRCVATVYEPLFTRAVLALREQLRPRPPRYESAAHASAAAATRWLERQRGRPLPALRRLMDEVRARVIVPGAYPTGPR